MSSGCSWIELDYRSNGKIIFTLSSHLVLARVKWTQTLPLDVTNFSRRRFIAPNHQHLLGTLECLTSSKNAFELRYYWLVREMERSVEEFVHFQHNALSPYRVTVVTTCSRCYKHITGLLFKSCKYRSIMCCLKCCRIQYYHALAKVLCF